jgi:predicted small secreted protein
MRVSLILICILLPACAAQTMSGYVGQDIRNVELAYGPPFNQIDLGNGKRAFQWSKVSVDTSPLIAVSTTEKDKKGRKSTQTQFVGGESTISRCVYTFIATWNPTANGWIVTGIRQPSFECTLGDLS